MVFLLHVRVNLPSTNVFRISIFMFIPDVIMLPLCLRAPFLQGHFNVTRLNGNVLIPRALLYPVIVRSSQTKRATLQFRVVRFNFRSTSIVRHVRRISLPVAKGSVIIAPLLTYNFLSICRYGEVATIDPRRVPTRYMRHASTRALYPFRQ